MNAEIIARLLMVLTGFVLAMFLIRFSLTKAKFQNEIQPHMLRISHQAKVNHDFLIAP